MNPRLYTRIWARENLPRLLVGAVGSGAFVLAAAWRDGSKELLFVLSWIIGALACVSILMILMQARTPRQIHGGAASAAILAYAWWTLGAAWKFLGPDAYCGGLAAISALVCMVPLSPGAAFVAWGAAASAGFVGSHLWPGSWSSILGVGIPLFAVGIHTAARAYIHLWGSVGAEVFSRVTEQTVGRDMVGVLARVCMPILFSERALIAGTAECTMINRAGKETPSGVDIIFSQGLLESARQRGDDFSIIRTKELGEQFHGPCIDWFGRLPHAMYIGVLSQVPTSNGREENLAIVVPLGWWAFIGGSATASRLCGVLVSGVRTALAAGRTRKASSDVVVSSQRAISERDEEINEVIHIANNVAQDISIHCESLLGSLSRGDAFSLGDAMRQVCSIEGSVRTLSRGVSDVKWLKELKRLKLCKRFDAVPISIVLSDLNVFAESRFPRDEGVRLIGDLNAGTLVRIASREYLEASLRLLVVRRLRALRERPPMERVITVASYVEDDSVIIEFSDSGSPVVFDPALAESYENDEREPIALLSKLVQFCGGNCDVQSTEGSFSSIISLRIPLEKREVGTTPSRGESWVLLVDDSEEVTTFYSRVAEALDLRYVTARSVSEARLRLAESGKPRLVITDITLGSESGIDLVRFLRGEFGSALPIIVVSGNAAATIADDVYGAGASKYLTKPVSRGKLFGEIRVLLAGGQNG